jgi:predicted anti-sigma-YlaC factor YlaD
VNLSCNVVRDLVGVCTDCAASDETKEAVQMHLAQCPACARYYFDYKRIGQRYRSRGTHTAYGKEDGYRELSERLRRKKQINAAASAAALIATAATTAAVFALIVSAKEK